MHDQQIVALYWQRDERAIAETAKKYGGYCTAIARNILGNREDAEEYVNDTYLNTWNAIPPHKPEVLSTFRRKLTRNLSFNRYRQNTANKRGGGELPPVLDELAECVTSGESVEKSVEAKELTQALDDFLSALPKQKQDMLVCRYWYTDSISDIATRFDMKEGAVSMTLSRLRSKLLDYLRKRGF